MRARMLRFQYLKQLRWLKELQAACQHWLKVRYDAASVIQVVVREWLSKNRVRKLTRAAIVIQVSVPDFFVIICLI